MVYNLIVSLKYGSSISVSGTLESVMAKRMDLIKQGFEIVSYQITKVS